MSFLLGDAYASSSASEDNSDEDAPLRDDAQSKSSDALSRELATAGGSVDAETGAAHDELPSADAVLAGLAAQPPSFLAPSHRRNTETNNTEIEAFDLLEAKGHSMDADEREREQRSELHAEADARSATSAGRKRPAASTATYSAAKRTAEPPPAKREKKDAKERVKGQRLRGQAGIGSDFKSWKSETEMQMRQQFD